jgi:hypothetical protein
MINEAMFRNRSQFNEFTMSLRRMCEVTGPTRVQLRNGCITNLVYKPADEKRDEEAMFHTPSWSLVWYPDGSSCKNADLDIVRMGIDIQ